MLVDRSITGVELRLVDDEGRDAAPGESGEIAIRGHNVMKGYWRKPDETAAAFVDDWFRTGDIATVDDDGFILDGPLAVSTPEGNFTLDADGVTINSNRKIVSGAGSVTDDDDNFGTTRILVIAVMLTGRNPDRWRDRA